MVKRIKDRHWEAARLATDLEGSTVKVLSVLYPWRGAFTASVEEGQHVLRVELSHGVEAKVKMKDFNRPLHIMYWLDGMPTMCEEARAGYDTVQGLAEILYETFGECYSDDHGV